MRKAWLLVLGVLVGAGIGYAVLRALSYEPCDEVELSYEIVSGGVVRAAHTVKGCR
jgi:hypothetical protein